MNDINPNDKTSIPLMVRVQRLTERACQTRITYMELTA